MMLGVYSVMDEKVGTFLSPVFMRSKGEAIRALTGELSNKDSMFARFPEDFTLYYLGTWDDKSGVFDVNVPERVVSVSELG